MLTVISPAKTLDFDSPASTRRTTQPALLEHAATLVNRARELSPESIQKLMGVSDNIAQLNQQRFMNWNTPFTLDNAKQAILAFKGDVYTGLEAQSLDDAGLRFAQAHLRILSGLYGVLRPLDLMQAYRLEMGLKLENSAGKNLYEFWGEKITHELNAQLKKTRSDVLLNLASIEYFKAIKPRSLRADILAVQFKEKKNGKYKVISFYAKKARGQMARFIIDREIVDPADLSKFKKDGYRYNKAESSARELVFTRDQSEA